jgi:hypothetical protein
MEKRTCGECLFFVPEDTVNGRGRCHMAPPTVLVIALQGQVSTFEEIVHERPRVKSLDRGCSGRTQERA